MTGVKSETMRPSWYQDIVFVEGFIAGTSASLYVHAVWYLLRLEYPEEQSRMTDIDPCKERDVQRAFRRKDSRAGVNSSGQS